LGGGLGECGGGEGWRKGGGQLLIVLAPNISGPLGFFLCLA